MQLCFYDFHEGFLFRDIYDMWHEEAKNGNIKKNKALLSKIFGLENPRSNQKIASWNVSSSEVEILAGLYSYKHCGEKIDKLSSKMFSSPMKQKSIKYFGFHYVFSQCSYLQELNVEHDDVLSVVLHAKLCGEGEPVEAYLLFLFLKNWLMVILNKNQYGNI